MRVAGSVVACNAPKKSSSLVRSWTASRRKASALTKSEASGGPKKA